jgi:hypothetical protein
MGRRSRKRSSDELDVPIPAAVPERRPAPLSHRARSEDRPDAPWGSFPLVEICIFVGIVLIVWAVLSGGDRREVLLSGGIALICLASLELTIREHFAGFRSHTTLLAAFTAVVVGTPLWFAGVDKVAVVAVAAVAGGLAFTGLRRVFVRKAGGLGFRA